MEEGGEDTGAKYIFVTDKGVTRKPHEGSRDYTGLATASYPNGDIYEGHYEAGVR